MLRFAPPTYSKRTNLPMIANLSGRDRLGIAPAAVAAGGFVVRWVVPLVVGAAGIAVAGSLAKSAIPEAPITTQNLGKASLLGGVAASAWFGSDLVPKEYRPIAYIVAALGAGGALYLLFEPPHPGAGVQDIEKARSAIEAYPTAAYRSIGAVIESPQWGGMARTGFGSRDFDVKILWVNNWSGSISFVYRFTVIELPDFETQLSPEELRERTHIQYPPADKARISFTEHGQSLPPIDYEIDLKTPGWEPVAVVLNVDVFDPNQAFWVTVATHKFFAQIL